jgi:thiamine biosynthesis lipoprotein
MNNQKQRRWQLPFLLLLIVGTVWVIRQNNAKADYRSNSGRIFGTFYNLTYQSDEDLQQLVEAELMKVDGSLSPFNDTSIISRINRNEEVMPDSLFLHVFNLA